MSEFVLEMRIRIPVELESLAEWKAELSRRVHDLDPSPRFITAEVWLVEASGQKPEPFTERSQAPITRGVKSEHL